MYTCYPFGYIGNAPQRFVVVADLISSELYQHDEIAGSEAE
jgi:sortase (surface protein transpeptidase)